MEATIADELLYDNVVSIIQALFIFMAFSTYSFQGSIAMSNHY